MAELKKDARIITCAPTGKASSRLQHPKAHTATLHSLLGMRDSFSHKWSPKPIVADLIIVDECSMVDLKLWATLLSMIPPGARLVLMGDPDQLPPVEAGAIFRDICQIGALPHIHLDEVMRTECKALLDLAEAIKRGDATKALALAEISPLESFKPQETMRILTPFHSGLYGTKRCNALIHQNTHAKTKPIIITKNDYHLGLMNGDIGTLEDGTASINGTSYPLALLSSYELAFAISIHKSQGSEFDHVHILLPEGSERFGRELLYTAITRAKHRATLYTTPALFTQILSRISYQKSNLPSRFPQPPPS